MTYRFPFVAVWCCGIDAEGMNRFEIKAVGP